MIWILLFGVIQLISFIFYGFDKYCAIKKKWRIPEKTLLLSAFIAPIGAFLGMMIFHHKIRKAKFKILVPLFIVLQVILFYSFYEPIVGWIL